MSDYEWLRKQTTDDLVALLRESRAGQRRIIALVNAVNDLADGIEGYCDVIMRSLTGPYSLAHEMALKNLRGTSQRVRQIMSQIGVEE